LLRQHKRLASFDLILICDFSNKQRKEMKFLSFTVCAVYSISFVKAFGPSQIYSSIGIAQRIQSKSALLIKRPVKDETEYKAKVTLRTTSTPYPVGAVFGIVALWTLVTNILGGANVANAGDPFLFNGDYADPFHPYCERHLKVSQDGKTFQYTGTAVGPKDDPVLRGCSPQEQATYGSRSGAFQGLIINDGSAISAGDGVHEGVWEPKNSNSLQKYGNEDGIRWNDGNKWVKLQRPEDVLSFPENYNLASTKS